MAEFPALPLFTDALTADCSHLTDEEFGRYMRILIIMWRSPNCRIPVDTQWISKRLHVDALAYAQLIHPIMQEFCTEDAGYWTQKRLLKEYKYVQELKQKRQKAAQERWGKFQDTEYKRKGGMQVHKQSISKAHAPTPTPTPTPTKESYSPLPPKQETDPFPQRPDWLMEKAWSAFLQHRKDIRSKLTPQAARLILAKLDKLRQQGDRPEEVIAQSIESNWAGVFPLKHKGAVNDKPSYQQRKDAAFDLALQRLEEGERGEEEAPVALLARPIG